MVLNPNKKNSTKLDLPLTKLGINILTKYD
jgi:hypothetical protein